MNKINFLNRFIFNNRAIKYLRFSSYFPLFGSILGIVVVLLTLSIMNGMEYSIFTKLKNISFPSKIMNLPVGQSYDNLITLLDNNGIDYKIGFQGKIILKYIFLLNLMRMMRIITFTMRT